LYHSCSAALIVGSDQIKMIKFFRGIIVLGGVVMGVGLAASAYTYLGSDTFTIVLFATLVCGTIAKLVSSFVK